MRDTGDLLEVEGHYHVMVMKLFTPWTFIVFRLFMLIVGLEHGDGLSDQGLDPAAC